MRDLRVQGNDLIAATHGRSFWAIDDLSPLRQLADSVTRRPSHLFQPATAMLWSGSRGGNGTGENPVSGVLVDYWLAAPAASPVKIEFTDAQGTLLRSFVSADSAATADSISYLPADSLVRTRAGSNRFAWNLRTKSATKLANTVLDYGTLRGAWVPPGEYGVRLIVGTDTLARRFRVIADPRVASSTADLTAQYVATRRTIDRINEIVENVKRVEDLQAQLTDRASRTLDSSATNRLADSAKAVRAKLEAVRAELYEVGCHVDQCTLDMPVKLYNKFITLNSQHQTGSYAPTRAHGEIYDELKTQLDVQLRALERIEAEDLARFNRLLESLGVPAIYVPPRKPIA